MYVYVRFDTGTLYNGESDVSVYNFVPSGSWTRVARDNAGRIIYGYGSSDEMTVVQSGEMVVLSGTLSLAVDNLYYSTMS